MQKQTGKKKLLILALTAVIPGGSGSDPLAGVFPEKRGSWPAGGRTCGFPMRRKSGTKNWRDTSGGQQGIKIPGYGEITVASGETHWNITLLNPEGNNCYFQYAITIDESETAHL